MAGEDGQGEGDVSGGSAAFEAAQNGRNEAIRAWKAYKHAQQALTKVNVECVAEIVCAVKGPVVGRTKHSKVVLGTCRIWRRMPYILRYVPARA